MSRKSKHRHEPAAVSPARAERKLQEGDEAWGEGDRHSALRLWRLEHSSGTSPEASGRLRRALLEGAIETVRKCRLDKVDEALSTLAGLPAADQDRFHPCRGIALVLGNRPERALSALETELQSSEPIPGTPGLK